MSDFSLNTIYCAKPRLKEFASKNVNSRYPEEIGNSAMYNGDMSNCKYR
jgi:hypothetical protein